MEQTSYEERRVMRCGFIPATEHVPGDHWRPDNVEGAVETCVGYTTSLPEVVDAVACFHQWATGALRDVVDPPPAPLIQILNLLKGSVLSKDAYRARELAAKNGGGS